MATNVTEYEQNLLIGQKYEQWVLCKWPEIYSGRSLQLMDGKQAQITGETKEGVEIKHDQLIDRYNRIYIETSEKSNANNKQYIPSGIYRNDNSRLYLVGDYRRWWLFSKRYLQWLDKVDPPFLYRPSPTPTSVGFCMPVRNANRLALDYQEFDFFDET